MNKIPELETMDKKWVDAIVSIQNSQNVKNSYVDLMNRRDREGGERPGGKKYTNEQLFDMVIKGSGDPIIILKTPNKEYAIGGRTRMFAALAAKANIKAVVLTPEILTKFRAIS